VIHEGHDPGNLPTVYVTLKGAMQSCQSRGGEVGGQDLRGTPGDGGAASGLKNLIDHGVLRGGATLGLESNSSLAPGT
jgi:hypothetical protein